LRIGPAGGEAEVAKRVLITGVGRFFGIKLAERLDGDSSIEEVIGVDLDLPEKEFEKVELVRADIRNPLFAKVLQAAEPDTVVHLNIIPSEIERGRTMMKEMNVIGSMQLFAACQKSRSLVVKSTTAVYGSEPQDPLFFTEEMAGRRSPSTAYCRDAVEIETYARDFGRRRPDVCMTILRFATILGPAVNNPFSRYLDQPVVPTILGFDPRIQFIHEDDVTEILYRAVVEDHPGIYNAGAPGPVPLSQVIRKAGRIQAPVLPPVIGLAQLALRLLPFTPVPPQILREIAYGSVSDTTRLEKEFGYRPKYSCLDAVADFRNKKRVERITRGLESTAWEKEVRAFVMKKQQQVSAAPSET
jgi:UDP-glucose 4-epimerase